MFWTLRKLKICSILSLVCFILFLTLAIVLPIVLQNFILSESRSEAQMQMSNQDLWGEVPGTSGANITRSFSLFNFTNPEGFIFRNETPIFNEVGPFIYEEYQNFTNAVIHDDKDGEVVDYKFYTYFILREGDPNTKIQTLNLGTNGGVWYQAATASKWKIGITAFASTIFTLDEYLYVIACSQGIFSQFLQTREKFERDVLDPYFPLIPKNMYGILWDDFRWGWGTWSTLRKWVIAAQGGYDSDTAFLLRDYFELSYEQMRVLLSILQDWLKTVQSLIKSWYCPDFEPCNGLYLTAIQMTSQNVTNNPPAGTIAKTPSIVTNNDTLRGYPEMSLFLNEVFLKNETFNTSEYREVKFTAIWAYGIFDHETEKGKWTKKSDAILHVGNLQFIFETRENFLKNACNLTLLEDLRIRFGLNTTYQAHVFVEWVNYIVDEFAMQVSRGGDSMTAAIGTLLSGEIYEQHNRLSGYLLMEILSNLMLYNLTTNKIDCPKFFEASSLNSTQSRAICSNISEFDNNTWFNSTNSIRILINLCWYRKESDWNEFVKRAGITLKNLQFICDSDLSNPSSFNAIKSYADLRIHTHYKCQNSTTKCSQTEITAIQWGNSTITRNVIPELQLFKPDQFVTSDSVHFWNSTLFPKIFEYYAVINKFPHFTTDGKIEGWDTQTARRLLTYERLFNQMIRYVLIDYDWGNTTDIDNLFNVSDIKALYNYLKYGMIELAFKGFAQVRTVDELLWGYTDTFIRDIIKNNDPQKGGDPSVNERVSLSMNYTYQDALNYSCTMYTGKSDMAKVRTYQKIYNQTHITINDTAFNGNESYVTYSNPWANEVTFEGTDSLANKPNIDDQTELSIYVPDLTIGGKGRPTGERVNYNGVDTLRYHLNEDFMYNKTLNPGNTQYYADRWNGYINLTKAKKFPIFISKYHFLHSDKESYQLATIYENNNTNRTISQDEGFDVKIDVEPYSGAGMYAELNIQANFEYKKDRLFPNPAYGMLPIFGLKRKGRWSDSAIDNKFGLLILGLKMKLALQIVFYVLAGIMLILAIFTFIKFRKNKRQNEGETLLPSYN